MLPDAEGFDLRGTGFNREGVVLHVTYLLATGLASSRLKPVPVKACAESVGPASAGKLLISV
jgi:hypothetical protein